MRISLCFLLVLFSSGQMFAQQANSDKLARADSVLDKRGEIMFSFTLPDSLNIQDISQIVSIDYRKGKFIRAYANRKEFNRFLALGIDYEIELPVIPASSLKSARDTIGTWYPTYEQYDSLMHQFQTNYPSLCQLVEIGTSVQGRGLYFLKISSDVQYHLHKPVVMYSSTMHGDEIAPFALMLRLINYLLTNSAQPRIQTLLDSCELWICPLANPDGTYAGGDQTVFESTRFNANNVDLNRNFPDPAAGKHPDGNVWQPENIAVMNFLKLHPPTLSANFHSGSEVVNYPWDTWAKGHPDSVWYQAVSGQYADTVQYFGPAGFYTDVNPNGITDGYAWYRVTGGRQDYVNYFVHGREVTIEMDEDKLAPESDLSAYWSYHYRSLINYLCEAYYGFRGQITDSSTNSPLKAEVEILGHDYDGSYIYSDSITGMYYRMLKPGTYNIQVSANGYQTQVKTGVLLNQTATDWIDFQLQKSDSTSTEPQFLAFPNPATNQLILKSDTFNGHYVVSVSISNELGQKIRDQVFENPVGEVIIDITSLGKGVYFLQVQAGLLRKTLSFVKL